MKVLEMILRILKRDEIIFKNKTAFKAPVKAKSKKL